MTKGSIVSAIKLVGYPPFDGSISYSFMASLDNYYTDPQFESEFLPNTGSNIVRYDDSGIFQTLTSPEQAYVSLKLSQISSFADITFSPASGSTGDLNFGAVNYTSGNAAAWASPGNIDATGVASGDIWLTTQGRLASGTNWNNNKGDKPYNTIPHEIGHVLGLRHSDVNAANLGAEDNQKFTMMSEVVDPGRVSRGIIAVTSPQLYDIASLQYLYGRNDDFASGDTPYSVFHELNLGDSSSQSKSISIWDGGGIDTINASNALYTSSSGDSGSLIDLRPGHFSSIGLNSYLDVSFSGAPTIDDVGLENISIAFGAYIENAIGGENDDVIIGNKLANILEGGDGRDILFGAGSSVVLSEEYGVDHGDVEEDDGDYDKIRLGGVDDDVLPDESSVGDTLRGGGGADFLFGSRGADILEGGTGNDFLVGGAGDDEIWGGTNDNDQGATDGTDKVDYSAAPERISLAFNGTSKSASIIIKDGEGGTDTLHSIEEIVGSAHNDVFKFDGVVPKNYSLKVYSGGGGETRSDVVNLLDANGGIHFVNTNTVGTIKNNEGNLTGQIQLFGFQTQIIGSDYDDRISDSADGNKRINGGFGNDEISTAGSTGDAMIKGGVGDDIITGGAGNDRLFGEAGTNILNGGEGSDYLASSGQPYMEGGDILSGGDGSDYLFSDFEQNDATLNGGAGNDVIDVRQARESIIQFGAGDGHDMVLAGPSEEGHPLGIGNRIDLSTLSKSEVTFIWDPQTILENIPPNGNPIDAPGQLKMQGDLVIKINATGDTILIQNIVATSTYWFNESEAYAPPFDQPNDFFQLGVAFPEVLFSDGAVVSEDLYGTNQAIALEFDSVSAYATALEEYQDAVTGDPLDNEGTSGNDDLGGSGGDDTITGEDGDDSFHSSGGDDTIDGGDGYDVLNLFGGRDAFTITRDGVTGIITVEDNNGLEGKLTLSAVEAIYFASENEEYVVEDLLGYVGTSGADTLTGTDRDNEIFGLDGNDTIYGRGGADLIDGGDDEDVLYGEDGDDFLVGGAGDNNLDGGDGVDTADYSAAVAAVTVNLALGTASVNGLGGSDVIANIENVVGSDFADMLTGDGLDNSLDGGLGTDTMAGRDGDDAYQVDNVSDVVTESANEGSDTIRTTLSSYTLGANVENLHFTGTGNFTGAGNALDNLIRGGADDDDLSGGDGDDSFEESGGDDLVDGGDGFDVMRLSGYFYDYSITDNLDGTLTVSAYYDETNSNMLTDVEAFYFTGDDETYTLTQLFPLTLTGTVGDDVLSGGAQGDSIDGGDGNDSLLGRLGSDVLQGGNGDDELNGGQGDDEIDGGDGFDTAKFSGSSYDYMVSFEPDGTIVVSGMGDGDYGYDILENVEAFYFAADDITLELIDLPPLGTSGNDVIVGSDRPDWLYGLEGDDSLTGGLGSDGLDGGEGADTMTGGDGDDYYYVDDAGDVIVEAGSDEYDGVEASISHTLGSTLENLTLTGSANLNGTGNASNNEIFGNDGDNIISDMDGDDYVRAGLGNDYYEMGAGDDSLGEDGGDDTFAYGLGDGHDIISEYLGLDVLEFDAGIDPGDVTVTADGDSYILTFDGEEGSVTIENGQLQDNAIEEVHFDDNTVWDATDLYNMAFGQSLMMMSAPGSGGGELDGAAPEGGTPFNSWQWGAAMIGNQNWFKGLDGVAGPLGGAFDRDRGRDHDRGRGQNSGNANILHQAGWLIEAVSAFNGGSGMDAMQFFKDAFERAGPEDWHANPQFGDRHV